jgi:hypothetical protein
MMNDGCKVCEDSIVSVIEVYSHLDLIKNHVQELEQGVAARGPGDRIPVDEDEVYLAILKEAGWLLFRAGQVSAGGYNSAERIVKQVHELVEAAYVHDLQRIQVAVDRIQL